MDKNTLYVFGGEGPAGRREILTRWQTVENGLFIEDLYERLGCKELDPEEVAAKRRTMETRMQVSAERLSVRALREDSLHVFLSSPGLKMHLEVEFDEAGRSLSLEFEPKARRHRGDNKIKHGWRVTEIRATALEVAALYQKLKDCNSLEKLL